MQLHYRTQNSVSSDIPGRLRKPNPREKNLGYTPVCTWVVMAASLLGKCFEVHFLLRFPFPFLIVIVLKSSNETR